jgi:F420-0:gamma-glutamyl ligase
MTDSRTTPLRPGVTGVTLAHSGFHALQTDVGRVDGCGRRLWITQGNMVDAFAAAAVLVMGEGSEQTPLAVISIFVDPFAEAFPASVNLLLLNNRWSPYGPAARLPSLPVPGVSATVLPGTEPY